LEEQKINKKPNSSHLVRKISKEESELILIGTAHVSRESVEQVRTIILEEKPDIVALELCEPRLEAITKKKKLGKTPITEYLKGNKAFFFLAYSLLASFEQKIGKLTGVKPGDEMIEGLNAAKEVGARVELVDRPIAITLKRVWVRAGLREKLRLLKEFFESIFGSEEVTKETVEQLKKQDVISEMMDELGRIVPSAKKVLVDERDEYIAAKLMTLKGKVVAVVGAGHLDGIMSHISTDSVIDIPKLEELPKKKSRVPKILSYILPVFIVGAILWGFWNSPEHAPGVLILWILINGIFSAAGAALAFAHPLTIVAAFLAAPITSLLPFVGAGWVAGLVEAKLRTPTVADFNGLRELGGVKDFWRNRFTRILLIAALSNLGSMVGTFIALPYIVSLL